MGLKKKKKVSGQRNAAAARCGGTDSQEQEGTLFPPVINNKYLCRVQVQEGFATPQMGPGTGLGGQMVCSSMATPIFL